MGEPLKPLNMHGYAATWEEEIVAAVRERDAAHAEIERLRAIAAVIRTRLEEVTRELNTLLALHEREEASKHAQETTTANPEQESSPQRSDADDAR